MQGIIMKKPSVIAVDRKSREIISLGMDAKKMLGKTPEGILAFKPLVGGVISDPDGTAKMMRAFFEITKSISLFSRPSVIVSIPYGVTEVEKRAVEDATLEAGAKTVALIETPLAATIGVGLRIGDARGNMIVDIGGGTTDVAVISLSSVVSANTSRFAGDNLDAAIIEYMRIHKNIHIGLSTAEELKCTIGSAHPSADHGSMSVFGRTTAASGTTSRATTATVSSEDVRNAMKGELDRIISTILKTLKETPPELSADVYDRGMILTGGTAMLRGIDTLITERTGIKVHIPKQPFFSVTNGIGKVIDSEGALGNLLKYRGR
jgi:rod shape-determining protein MreB